MISKDQIRDVFLVNGFTIKSGETDLKPYVFEAAYELIRLIPEGWQPIDTSPADGSHILLYCPAEIYFGGSPVFIGYKIGGGYKWKKFTYLDSEEYDLFPTHWMPLPDPPNNGEAT